MIHPQTISGGLYYCAAKALTILTITLLLAGCGSTGKYVRTYLGPPRERNEIAYLNVDRKFMGPQAIVRTVDGYPLGSRVKMNNTRIIEVLPGKHFVSIDFVKGNSRSVDPVYVDFEAKGGGMYELKAAPVEQSFGDALVSAMGGYGYWTAWVVDLDTGEVVGGVPRKTPYRWYEK